MKQVKNWDYYSFRNVSISNIRKNSDGVVSSDTISLEPRLLAEISTCVAGDYAHS